MFSAKQIVGGVVALAVLGGAGVAAHCYFGGACALKQQQAFDKTGEVRKLAAELVRLSREGAAAEVRAWLLSHSPATVSEALFAIDNTVDPAGRARLNVLAVIFSLGSEGLKPDATAEWATVLRRVAEGALHAGPERADFFAKSYLMEGNRDQAAQEYRRFPESEAAQLFFKQYPELTRLPAAAK